MLDWTKCPAVHRSPDILANAWTFTGTRVPVLALFENLNDGVTVDEFLELFPGVSRAHVTAVTLHVRLSLLPR